MIRILPAASSELAEWFDAYPYHEYRRYRGLTRGQSAGYLEDLLLPRARLDGSLTLVSRTAGKTCGVLLCSLLDWDTRALKTPSARIDFLCSTAEMAMAQQIRIKSSLVGECLARASGAGTKFLSCRADADDFSSLRALEENGFRFMDTVVTFAYEPGRTAAPALKEMFSVRPCAKADVRDLARLAQKVFSKSRFHLDGNIPSKLAEKVFGLWVEESFRRKDPLLVLEAGKGAVKGFITYRPDEALRRAAGVRLWGHGLLGVDPRAKGGLIRLMQASFKDVVRRKADCLEYDTRLTNEEVVRACGFFGLRMVRARHTFHRWL